MFLLDTNVLSELRKPRPHGAVTAWFAPIRKDWIKIPAAAIGEIQAGIEVTRQQDASKAAEIELWLDRVIAFYEVIPMDAGIFREWARMMAGKSDDLYTDAMIAATAHTKQLTVVTRNTKDFARFRVKLLNPFLTPK
jgi:toxin FitB